MSLFLFCCLIYLIGGVGVSITYHRILTHKSAEYSPWFEKIMVLLILPAGTPIQWVGTHRQHHRFTDRKGDPHSPHIDGFWYAHCGWYISQKNPIVCFLYAVAGPFRMIIDGYYRPRSNQQYNYLAKEIAAIPFYQKISLPNIFTFLVYLYLVILVGSAFYFWSYSGIFALWVMLIVVYNLGDGVNSLGHIYGERLNKGTQARNNIFLRFLAFGEGAHSNHHTFPNYANFNSPNSNFDIGFWALRVFKKIGLVKNIKR